MVGSFALNSECMSFLTRFAAWFRDRRKLTFYFVAEKRIDFRELVRELFRYVLFFRYRGPQVDHIMASACTKHESGWRRCRARLPMSNDHPTPNPIQIKSGYTSLPDYFISSSTAITKNRKIQIGRRFLFEISTLYKQCPLVRDMQCFLPKFPDLSFFSFCPLPLLALCYYDL